MEPLIKITRGKCKLCYACVRECPAKAIKIETGSAQIIPDRCIGCGSCVKACVPDAIVYRNSKQELIELLNTHQNVIALMAPSISGEFSDIGDYRNFVSMIRMLGFKYVMEVAFGADLIAFKYKELYDNYKGKYYITTNCPVTVSHVEKYYPDIIDNLAPFVSPMIATAMVAHKKYGAECKLVYIGPCIHSKEEILLYDGDRKIEVALTYKELRELFAEFGITENVVEYSEFDPPLGRKGGLFPISRGMLQAVDINEDLLTGRILITTGRENFLSSLKTFQSSHDLKQHLDIMYCEGCIMGPGTTKGANKFERRSQVIKYVNKRLKSFNEDEWQQSIDEFLQFDFSRKYNANDNRLPEPTEDQLTQTLKDLDKEKPENQISCGSCGYATCREFAIAINQGLAKPEMCTTFSMTKMRKYIRELASANEKLENTRIALHESEELARAEQMLAKEAAETVSVMLQKLPTGVVIVDEHLGIVEANKYFIEILGEDAEAVNDVIPGLVGADLKTLIPFHKLFASVLMTGEEIINRDVYYGKKLLNLSVFTIRKNKIVGGIIRDMQAPDVRKDEVIHRAKEVIRENLETVQQIAFLLGESASKTEKILSSIIQSHKTED
jgi:iron only hydrogenase large subunit-like protein